MTVNYISALLAVMLIAITAPGAQARDRSADTSTISTVDDQTGPSLATVGDPGRTAASKRAAARDFWTIGFENDLFFGTDRHYTSGVRGAYVSPEGRPLWGLGGLADALPFVGAEDAIRSQHSISQYIFTPDDITLENPPPGDRPYAGWLTLDTSLLAQGANHLDIVTVSLGVTGGASLSQASQIGLHAILPNSPRPQGWPTQVDFEVTAQLRYDRIWYIGHYSDDEWGIDLQPRFGVDVGTAFINSYVGGQLRIGSSLSREPGPALNRPGKPGADWFALPEDDEIEFYAFVGFDLRAVGRNFTLDGGLRPFDRDVDHTNFVTDFTGGAVLTTAFTRVSFTFTRRGREFVTQPEPDWYGALYFSFPF